MSARAIQYEDTWYMARRRPPERVLWPAWKRYHDIMLKLAMIFSVADSPDLVIHLNHVIQATQIIDQQEFANIGPVDQKEFEKVIEASSVGAKSDPEVVAQTIYGPVQVAH